MKQHECNYGCGGIGYHYFKTADKWCCKPSFRQCKGYSVKLKESSLLRHKDSLLAQLRNKLENKELKCAYCGEIANYIVGDKKGCCTKAPKDCPNHKQWRSQLLKDAYKNDATRSIKMAKSLLEAQNRPEVKEKKRIAMTKLHNEDCMPCKDFQLNFKKGRKLHKETLAVKSFNRLARMGMPVDMIPTSHEERLELRRYISYMLTLERDKKKNRETLRSRSNSFKERVIVKGGLSI